MATLANVYTVIAEAHSGANPAIKWRNTLDFYLGTTPTPSDNIFTDIADFMQAMIWDADILQELRVYNWHVGAQPYPQGAPLFVIPYGLNGSGSGDWVNAPTSQTYSGNDVCLRIDRLHNGVGKPGRFFIRNLVRYDEIQAADGQPWVLIPNSPYSQAHLDAIVASTGLGTHFAGGAGTGQIVVVQYSKKHNTTPTYGQVTQLQLIGVTTNKPTRKGKK